MDKLTRYRDLIRKELEGYAEWIKPTGQLRCEVVFDPVLDHFELIEVGWENNRRVHTVVFHIDIIDGKVWIQHDATDRPIATELMRVGIPKEDIVLGFHLADVRQYTGYGVG